MTTLTPDSGWVLPAVDLTDIRDEPCWDEACFAATDRIFHEPLRHYNIEEEEHGFYHFETSKILGDIQFHAEQQPNPAYTDDRETFTFTDKEPWSDPDFWADADD